MISDIEAIKRRRVALGLTQKKLAMVSGVSQSFIAKMESGKIDPAYSKVVNIMGCLGGLERKGQLKAKDIMAKSIIRIKSKNKVGEALSLMRQRNISQLPVFSGRQLAGSFSERTLLDRISRGEDLKKLSESKVEEVMDDVFPRIDEETPINTISELLKVNQAVLITKKLDVVGIITKADLLKKQSI